MMAELPAWWDERKRNNKRSKAQERLRASQTNGRVSAGSGSSWRAPQDVRSEDALEQVKFTQKSSYTVTVGEWAGIRADAHRSGRTPRLLLDFPQQQLRLVIVEEPYPRGGV